MERDHTHTNGEIAASPSPSDMAMIAPPDLHIDKKSQTVIPQSLPESEGHYRYLTSTTAQIFWTIKADGTVQTNYGKASSVSAPRLSMPPSASHISLTQEAATKNGTLSSIAPVQDMLNGTERQIAMLNRLVNDLIDISRIPTDKLKLHIRRLPIVRQIVEMHHGKVYAESTLGKGSTFHVILPIASKIENAQKAAPVPTASHAR